MIYRAMFSAIPQDLSLNVIRIGWGYKKWIDHSMGGDVTQLYGTVLSLYISR